MLNILSGFTYKIMCSGLIFFFIGFIFAFSILEVAISFIQAQVFVVLTASYIKDSLYLHSDSSASQKSGLRKLNLTPNQRRYYSTKTPKFQKHMLILTGSSFYSIKARTNG
jgi:hypothetical protein